MGDTTEKPQSQPQERKVCQACKQEPNKTITINENGQCPACGKMVKGMPQDTNKNGIVGAPTKYRPEYVQSVYDYLVLMKKTPKRLIGVEDFAEYLGVDDTTILSWANKKLKDEKGNLTNKLARPEFFAAIKKLKHMQKNQLVNDGLYGGKDVSSPMAIFLLKANHHMIETQHVDMTTKGKEMPTPILGGASVSKNDSDK